MVINDTFPILFVCKKCMSILGPDWTSKGLSGLTCKVTGMRSGDLSLITLHGNVIINITHAHNKCSCSDVTIIFRPLLCLRFVHIHGYISLIITPKTTSILLLFAGNYPSSQITCI